ncbi:MAG: hypothetical protein ABI639_05600 [Thermoanaerobaculia bacterium]
MSGRRSLALLTALAVLSGCTAGHRITRFQPDERVSSSHRGVYYALPRTVLQVTVEAKRTETLARGCFEALIGSPVAGPLAGKLLWESLKFAEAPEAGGAFSVEGVPAVSALAEPDPRQIFKADLDSSFWIQRKIELNFGPLGVLESASSLAQSQALDFVAGVVKVAGAAFTMDFSPTVGIAPNLAANLVERCRPYAEQIVEDREFLESIPNRVRDGLLPRASADWLLEALDSRIQRNLGKFLVERESSGTVSCFVRPATRAEPGAQASAGPPRPTAKPLTEEFDVLKVSASGGFSSGVDADCLIPGEFQAARPKVSIGIENDFSLHLGTKVLADQVVNGLYGARLDLAQDPGDEQSFYYRIPAVARVTLESRPVDKGSVGRVVAVRDLIVAQYGIVASLPRQRAMESQYALTLDPMTGALVKLSSDREALDAKFLGTLEGVVADRVQARDAAAAAKAEAEDELTQLERERKLLDERKKIRDLRLDLGEDAP